MTFLEESSCTEDIEYDDDGGQRLQVTTSFFPNRLAGRPLLQDYYALPHGIAKVYQQTHAALASNLTILAGTGVRIIVEAVCKDRSAKGSNLKERIDDLVTQGIVTRDAADILHSIRLLGNDSAHEAKSNTEEELATALEVVEHILSSVYLIPAKAAKLKPKPRP